MKEFDDGDGTPDLAGAPAETAVSVATLGAALPSMRLPMPFEGLKRLITLVHPREPWSGQEKVHVSVTLDTLKGRNASGARRKAYEVAKKQGSHDLAALLAKQCLTDDVIGTILEDVRPYIEKAIPLVFVVPHPPFDDVESEGYRLPSLRSVKNVLPIQYAANLAVTFEGTVDTEIIQKGRVGRTEMKPFPRFLFQPCFEGSVRTDVAYIIVDDVVTRGGTIAALRSYIVSNGGTVASYSALAHGSGRSQLLALGRKTWDELDRFLGEGFSGYWNWEIGHDSRCLTESEGRLLAQWAREQRNVEWGEPFLQRLRNRLAQARATGE